MEVAARGLQSNACAVVTKPLSVLLIDDNPARAEIVEAGLAAAGYRLLARLEGTQDLIGRVRELEPDVVVVSIDSPSRDTIEDMRRTTDLLPRPIALFVDRSDPATIAAAMEAGVSAYVVKGLAQDRVRGWSTSPLRTSIDIMPCARNSIAPACRWSSARPSSAPRVS